MNVRVQITQGGVGYVVTSEDIPGYSAEARTIEAARENYKKGLAFSLRVPETDIVLIEVRA